MDHKTFSDYLGSDAELPPRVEWLLRELESEGWYPRGRMGSSGLRYWPDNGRSRQIIVEIGYPVTEHRFEVYREHTGLSLTIKEPAKEVVNDD